MRSYLLAAGRGTRAGGPKAWLPHDGRTLLESQLAFLLTRFRPEQICVTIQEEWRARCEELNRGVNWIAADPDAPAFASLRKILDGAAREDWSFVHHVDMPVWVPELFDALAAEAGEADVDAVAPRYAGRRGHPVLLSPRAQAALKLVDASAGRLDRWLEGRRVRDVEVPFACVRENWNDGPITPSAK